MRRFKKWLPTAMQGVLIILSCFFLLIAFGVIDGEEFGHFLRDGFGRFCTIILAVAAIALCAWALLDKFFVPHSPTENLRVMKMETGTITIGESALVHMVQKVARDFADIQKCDVRLMEDDGKLMVQMRVVLPSDSVIPDVITRLQKNIIDYVKIHAGLAIGGVTVFVETAQSIAISLAKEKIALPAKDETTPSEKEETAPSDKDETAPSDKEEVAEDGGQEA